MEPMDVFGNKGKDGQENRDLSKKPKSKDASRKPKRKKRQKEDRVVRLDKDTVLDLDEFEKEVSVNKNAKDSVFLDLFGQKEYLLQLYQVIHPEDKTIAEDDLKYITINRVLLRGIYNDLGFMAGDKLMILVEAQSTWTMNIIPRVLIYLAHSLQSYFKATDANIYSATRVYIPKIELYVLFTCDEARGIDTLSLSEKFFGGKECDVDVKVHVLYRDVNELLENADVVWQYTAFTKVFDLCVKRFGQTAEAVNLAIRICQNKKILAQYLGAREEEVRRTMLAIFEQEEAERIDRRIFRKEVTKEVTERVTKKVTKKVTEEVTGAVTKKLTEENKEKTKKNAIMLVKDGELSVHKLSLFFPELSDDDIEDIKKELGL